MSTKPHAGYTRRFRATERKRKRDPRTGAVQAIVPGLITRRNFELLVCNITPAGGAGRASGVLGGWASRALGGPGVRRVGRVGVPRVRRAGRHPRAPAVPCATPRSAAPG